jgi:hypothetical protein
MDDLGAPSSYLAIEPGVKVFSRDGDELGEVQYVLADPEADLFDGIVVDTSGLPGGLRFADAPQVAARESRSSCEAPPGTSSDPGVTIVQLAASPVRAVFSQHGSSDLWHYTLVTIYTLNDAQRTYCQWLHLSGFLLRAGDHNQPNWHTVHAALR